MTHYKKERKILEDNSKYITEQEKNNLTEALDILDDIRNHLGDKTS